MVTTLGDVMPHRWKITLAICGLVLGLLAAISVPYLLMRWSQWRTGYDAGNAGILFCCTLALFPLVGLIAGLLVGTSLDHRQDGDP
ncbi:MAG: hypothetical protein AAF750_12665 [Planctomycetota bacterium]